MAQLLFNAIVILFVEHALSQDTIEISSEVSGDPVSALLKDLGLLFLDVDKANTEVDALKVEPKDVLKEQRDGRPRSEHFNRILEDYRRFQRTGTQGVGYLSLRPNLLSVSVKTFKVAGPKELEDGLKEQIDGELQPKDFNRIRENYRRFQRKDPLGIADLSFSSSLVGVNVKSHKLIDPKVELEDELVEQTYGRPRSEDFNRIRENYRRFQRKDTLGIGHLSLSSSLFGIKVKTNKQDSSVDVSIPLLPLKLKIISKNPKVKESNSQGSDNAEQFASKEPESHFPSKIQVGSSDIKVNSEFTVTDTSSKSEQTRRIQDSESKVVDSDEGFIAKVPEPEFDSKTRMRNSEMKLDSEFPFPDITSQAKFTKRVLKTGSEVSDSAGEYRTETPQSRLASRIKVGNSQINGDSAFVLQDQFSEEEQGDLHTENLLLLGDSAEERKRWKRKPLIRIANEELVSLFIKIYNEFLFSNNRSITLNSWGGCPSVSGRTLGNVFYSESAFDTITKEALRNSKWALDSDLSPYKIHKNFKEISRILFSNLRPEAYGLQGKSGMDDLNTNADSEATERLKRYAVERRKDSAERLTPDGSDRSNPTKAKTQPSYIDQTNEEPLSGTILLSTTNEGISVKLRIGPEFGNPYRYLHGILSAADVTLNIHMTQKDRTEPTEKEKLPSPSLCVDLSDENQSDSFLKTLKKFSTFKTEE